MLSDKPGVQDLVGVLAAKGLKYVVVSPGSRHAPISLSFHHHPDIELIVVPDERAAAYFALGIAQYTGVATAVLCTSGTAAANYGPAIAEAFYQQIPLIAITADRPEEWIDQGDGQTIRQKNLLTEHTLAAYHLPSETSHPDSHWYLKRSVNEAWELANGTRKGPVHLNVPLREPLYNIVEGAISAPATFSVIHGKKTLSQSQIESLQRAFSSYTKIMVLVGMGQHDAPTLKALRQLSALPQVLMLTETTANLHDETIIGCIDRLLMAADHDQQLEMQPELLITLGDQIISKKIKTYLRQAKNLKHWHLGAEGKFSDTYQRLEFQIDADPHLVFSSLASLGGCGSYAVPFKALNKDISNEQTQRLEAFPWCDLTVFGKILPALPANSILQMGNSSVVRYIQLFDGRSDITYYGNRGTSGIDGSTSTAAGMAHVANKTTTLITGDIAFMYDINGLWHEHKNNNLKIIVVNNGGGGIFKIIDGPRSTNALELIFEAKHNSDVKQLAAHFHIDYFHASHQESLTEGLDWLYNQPGCKVLEIDTADAENEIMLQAYFKELKNRNTQA
jgi:2-succinyl-5-enolpyruvyl-6-hydroxy-3-cyclohexene-1-carboxylate synthase